MWRDPRTITQLIGRFAKEMQNEASAQDIIGRLKAQMFDLSGFMHMLGQGNLMSTPPTPGKSAEIPRPPPPLPERAAGALGS